MSLFSGLSVTPSGDEAAQSSPEPPPPSDAARTLPDSAAIAADAGLFSGMNFSSPEAESDGISNAASATPTVFGFVADGAQGTGIQVEAINSTLEPTSGFGFLGAGATAPLDDPFADVDVSPTVDNSTSASEISAGFGFVSSSIEPCTGENEALARISSGFGFVGGDNMVNSEDAQDASGTTPGFSFVVGEGTSASVGGNSSASGFSFLGGGANPSLEETNVASSGLSSGFGFVSDSTAPSYKAEPPPPPPKVDLFDFLDEVTVAQGSPNPHSLASSNGATAAATTTPIDMSGLFSASQPPPPPPPPASQSLSLFDSQLLLPEPTVRKKTRKAMLPGHAARAAEHAALSAPTPTSQQTEEAPAASPVLESMSNNGGQVVADEKPKDDAFSFIQQNAKGPPTATPDTNGASAHNSTDTGHQDTAKKTDPPPPQTPVGSPGIKPAALPPQQEEMPRPEQKCLPPPPPPQATPPAPPSPTSSECLRKSVDGSGIRVWLEAKTLESIEQQRGVLDERAASLNLSQRATVAIAALRQELSTAEADQNRLCDEEQFEEAGAIDATIQDFKAKIAAKLEDVTSVTRRSQAQIRELLELTRTRGVFTNDALDRMKTIENENEMSLEEECKESERRLQTESARLDSERKRVETQSSHLDKDSLHLGEEEAQVQGEISEQTVSHVEERDRAVEERSAVEQEISALQRQLDEKMEVRLKLVETVDSCDIRISAIKSKFEKQLLRLNGKRERIDAAQQEIQADRQQVAQMDTDLQRQQALYAETSAEQEKQISELHSEWRKLSRREKFLAWHLKMRTRWQTMLEPHQEMLNVARSRWETTSSASSASAEALAGREAEAAKLRSQIDTIKLQMPALEAEKKLAVSSRSFKEAGRISEDIRKREEERKALEVELDKIQGELNTTRESVTACHQDEEQALAELTEAEATCDVEEARILQRQFCDLEKLRARKSAGESERSILEQESRVISKARDHLIEKHSLAVGSLEPIPSEGEEDPVSSEAEDEEAIATTSQTRTPEPPTLKEAHLQTMSAEEMVAAGSRIGELAELRVGLDARISAFEKQIEEACEAEDYDRAEELEEQRKQVDQELKDTESEHESLTRQLAIASEAAVEACEQLETAAAPAESGTDGGAPSAAQVEDAEGQSSNDKSPKEQEVVPGADDASPEHPVSPSNGEPSGFSFVGNANAEDDDNIAVAPDAEKPPVGEESSAAQANGESTGFSSVGGGNSEDVDVNPAAGTLGDQLDSVNDSDHDNAEHEKDHGARPEEWRMWLSVTPEARVAFEQAHERMAALIASLEKPDGEKSGFMSEVPHVDQYFCAGSKVGPKATTRDGKVAMQMEKLKSVSDEGSESWENDTGVDLSIYTKLPWVALLKTRSRCNAEKVANGTIFSGLRALECTEIKVVNDSIYPDASGGMQALDNDSYLTIAVEGLPAIIEKTVVDLRLVELAPFSLANIEGHERGLYQHNVSYPRFIEIASAEVAGVSSPSSSTAAEPLLSSEDVALEEAAPPTGGGVGFSFVKENSESGEA